MKILFISKDLIAGDIAYRLVKEGHDVKLYIDDLDRRDNFDGMVEKTLDWEKELPWVGRDGLIIFDDVGYGTQQDSLRKQGYTVFGGSEGGDRLEQDRSWGQSIFESAGMPVVPLYDFKNSAEALSFVKKNQSPTGWVIKQNNHHYSKILNYVGHFKDSSDVMDMLQQYIDHPQHSKEPITLQEKICGVEIGIGRYFNGKDWVGPIEYNIEHPKFFPGDIGPMTSEMGTLGWYESNEDALLYKKTTALVEPFLRDIDFRGDFEINCIVNETGIYPLEATARFGSPIVHLHSELHTSPWGEFLYAIAQGKQYDLQWKKGYGIVTLLATPPFPYGSETHSDSIMLGNSIHFNGGFEHESEHIHFEEVSYDIEKRRYYISDSRGYITYITSVQKTVEDAQNEVQRIIQGVYFPKMMYRNDIGKRFVENDLPLLKKWGYL